MRPYFWNIGHLVFLDCFGDLINLFCDTFRSRSSIREIILNSKISIGTYHQRCLWRLYLLDCVMQSGGFHRSHFSYEWYERLQESTRFHPFHRSIWIPTITSNSWWLYSIGSSHFGNDLHNFCVVVTTISADNESCTLCSRRRNCLKNCLW